MECRKLCKTNKNNIMKNRPITLALIVASAGVANAQTVTVDTVSSSMPFTAIGSLIDGNFNTRATINSATDSDHAGTITFGFNSLQDLSSFQLWDDYNVPADNHGLEGFTLEFFSGLTRLGSEAFTSAILPPGAISLSGTTSLDASEGFTFATTYTDVDSVILTTTSGGRGGNFTQIREVNFNSVPEPSSTALLGLGALGLLVRRKR